MYKKGFTLIELLVVVAIIGVLASIVLSSLSEAREQSRMARRIATLNQIENALEIYYLDNGRYPIASSTWGANNGSGGDNSPMLQFESDLAPYIIVDFSDVDQFNTKTTTQATFLYRSSPADNYQKYGISLGDLSGRYIELAQNDVGFSSNSYEVGELPKYCVENYTGGNQAWRGGTIGNNLCLGGN